MTQFFDALERQLVALSMETPRMTPRARARRRLAVGTVTVLCLFALVAGASVLPRLYRSAAVGRASLLATLRPRPTPRWRSSRSEVSMPGGASAFVGGDRAVDERDCGHQVAVQRANAPAVARDVDDTSGELRGLVCLIWSDAEARRESKRGATTCPKKQPAAGVACARASRGSP